MPKELDAVYIINKWNIILQNHSVHIVFYVTFNLVSELDNAFARKGMAPASTTVSARSILCLLISNKAEALICFKHNSGSCKAKTKSGTAPINNMIDIQVNKM